MLQDRPSAPSLSFRRIISRPNLHAAEWAAAFKRDPTGDQGLLVPVRVRPCDIEGLLGQVVYIDLVDQDEAAARATLMRGIKHERRKPSSPPAFPSTLHASHAPEHPSFPGALPAVRNIPYPRNPYFTGREELLHRLAASLRAGETVGISQPQAVSGLGGVGKTQIALEYAYRYYQDYDAVLWTRADTQEALISGFVVFAALLELPVQEERDQLKIVQAVKHWLTSHTRWLLLLDNADDLTLVRDFLPPAGRGHTLLTTRASSMGKLAHALEVDALDSKPGALLLLRRTDRLAPDASLEQATESERAVAISISQELGGLPLALDQAGAYIEETRVQPGRLPAALPYSACRTAQGAWRAGARSSRASGDYLVALVCAGARALCCCCRFVAGVCFPAS